jgi:hypothetical protein
MRTGQHSSCLRAFVAVFGIALFASTPHASAQTAPLPAPFAEGDNGFLTRGDWLLSVAPMSSGDPRFSWSVRQRFDVDVAHYPRGRVNLFFDNEIVMGSERRSFDFNHGNTMFETSASGVLPGGVEASLVFHHVSRHLIDRPADRVVAWHTVAGRVEKPLAIGRSTVTATAEFHRVVQHTYVDYQWLSQFTGRFEQPFANHVRVVRGRQRRHGRRRSVGARRLRQAAQPRPAVWGAGRGRCASAVRQSGARSVSGLRTPRRRLPAGARPLSWVEAGFRLSSP